MVIGLLVLGLLAMPQMAEDKPPPLVVGFWQGTLHAGAIELRLGFNIDRKWGMLRGTMDSVDQEVNGIPIKRARFSEGELTLDISAIKANFVGKMQADGKSIVGEFEQLGKTPMTLTRLDGPLVLKRPQLPKKPYPYDEEIVTFASQAQDITLAGTFTRPKREGPFTAVVLISGSGPQDRDESIMGHKPFLVLADHLTRRGIAVLRFDDRGRGKSTGKFATATSEDFANDVRGAMAYLKMRKEVKQIGLLGHSEEGLIAPMVAADNKEVAFIVLLAGPGTSGAEILLAQGQLIGKAGGGNAKALERQSRLQKQMFALVAKELDADKLKAALESVLNDLEKELSEVEKKEFKAARATINAQLSLLLTPWFRFFLAYDPRPTLAKVKCPVLAVNGELDLQVPSKVNLAVIDKALRDAGNTQVTTREFAGLNHLFQPAKTGLPGEYGKIETTFSPEVLEAVSYWIKKW